MSKAETPKQVLVAARWIAKKLGWCQWSFFRDKEGAVLTDMFVLGSHHIDRVASVCMLGALRLVETDEETRADAKSLLSKSLPTGSYSTISSYNDYGTTSKEDVLKVFDKAIDLASKND